jgi:hypothetical protein
MSLRYLTLAVLLLALASPARAEGPYLKLDRFSLLLSKYTGNRELQTPEIPLDEYRGKVAAEFDLSIGERLFWRNEVHGAGTNSKFMTVGWEWEIGFRLGAQIEILWHHHSQHVMDQAQPYYWDSRTNSLRRVKYPVEDSIGIRLNFVEPKR